MNRVLKETVLVYLSKSAIMADIISVFGNKSSLYLQHYQRHDA